MLRYELVYADDTSAELKDVISAQLDCQLDVPADSLVLTLPFEEKLRGAAYAAAWEGETLRFYGPVDEVISVRRSGELIVRLRARSLAALLLDNEAEPVTYSNPSNRMMAERHLIPFGVSEYDNERYPLFDSLQIEKGMSHWQALERFCRKRYGSFPRIEGRRAYLSGYHRDGKAFFGNNGIRCFALRESLLPCRLISEVKVKLNNVDGYASSIKNSGAAHGRVRYLNATADNITLDTARRIIEKGCRESYLLRLSCAGMHVGLLGMTAEVEDSGLGKTDGLRVTGVRYQMNKKGELTTVSLRKERY